MTADRAKILIAAICSTLYDLELEEAFPVPASQIYLALGMSISDYSAIACVLRECGLAEVTSETVRLTDKGRELGRECSAIYAEKANSAPEPSPRRPVPTREPR